MLRTPGKASVQLIIQLGASAEAAFQWNFYWTFIATGAAARILNYLIFLFFLFHSFFAWNFI